jgi:opacity protein-like surface antigen
MERYGKQEQNMKKSILAAVCLAAALIALAAACAKPPAPEPAPEPARAVANPYVGLWEGAAKKGETLVVRFSASEWEATKEIGGVAVPYYKGTYSHIGLRLDLQITHEADLKTMGWVPQRGSLGPGLVGRLAGGRLTIAALTDAELTKKR